MKMWRTGASQSLVFKVVKVFSWAVPHEKDTLARVSAVSGTAIAEKLRMKRQKKKARPMKDMTYFIIVGIDQEGTAATFAS